MTSSELKQKKTCCALYSDNTSFMLQQINGRGIRGTFHGDHLKAYKG